MWHIEICSLQVATWIGASILAFWALRGVSFGPLWPFGPSGSVSFCSLWLCVPSGEVSVCSLRPSLYPWRPSTFIRVPLIRTILDHTHGAPRHFCSCGSASNQPRSYPWRSSRFLLIWPSSNRPRSYPRHTLTFLLASLGPC